MKDCGVLYDVNGGCVLLGVFLVDNSVYNSCFCNDFRLVVWKMGIIGVCFDVCVFDLFVYLRI